MSVNNCKCNEQQCKEYCDCSGNTFCICSEVIPVAELPILIPPLPFDFTLGHSNFYRSKIETNVYKKKGVAYLHIKRPFKVGDIVQLFDDRCTQYYLRKKLRRKDNFNNFVFEIRRVDGIRISYLDLNKLIKGKLLLVKGHFADKKQK